MSVPIGSWNRVYTEKVIPLKLYGETYAEVTIFSDNYRSLRVLRERWGRDEALLLADFIT